MKHSSVLSEVDLGACEHSFNGRVDLPGFGRVSPWLEALQLSLSHPGPVFLTVAVAFLQGHGDVVQEYFFLNHLPLYNGVYC